MNVVPVVLLMTVSLLAPARATAQSPQHPADTGSPPGDNQQHTDVLRYDLAVEVFPESRSISGSNTVTLTALNAIGVVELQLDDRLSIDRARVNGQPAEYVRDQVNVTISLPEPVNANDQLTVSLDYHGIPFAPADPPWEGGVVWSQSANGKVWLASVNFLEGCDLWWPCKDHFVDRPDSMSVRVTVPAGLSAAMAGTLQSVDELADGRRRFHWAVSVPLKPNMFSLNVGPYVRIEDQFQSVNGASVPIEFWALEENEDKARKLVESDLKQQIAWYEATLGPFPFGDDKLGVAETPFLGMEHQTMIAYGNGYQLDDHGFDRLLQHELSHEWFGNLMTRRSLNHLWLHEGFGTYMQPAYSLDRDGIAAYHHRMYELYLGLENCRPIVQEGVLSPAEVYIDDIYDKGAWIAHSLRWLIGEKAFWASVRRLLYDTDEPWTLTYPISPVYRTTDDLLAIAEEESGIDLDWFFNVYVHTADLPALHTTRSEDRMKLEWQVSGERVFPMPVPVSVDGEIRRISLPGGQGEIRVNKDARVLVDPQMKVLRYLPIIARCDDEPE